MKDKYPWLPKRIAVVVLVCIAIFGIGPGTWYYLTRQTGPIYDFTYERDNQGIHDIFKTNWYWLIADNNEYSPEFMMKYHAPNSYEPYYVGKLAIKVLRQPVEGKDTFVGFTSYYMTNEHTGKIQFVAVKQEFRGKGYGEQLTKYALNDLLKKGARTITILTRVNNEHALKIYTRLGFREIARDEKYVSLQYHTNGNE
jgi:ribosomal protein S18 acetylase RimI-like enzyme